MSKRNLILISIFGILLIVFLAVNFFQKEKSSPLLPTTQQTPQTKSENIKDIPRMETIADNLEVPWALAFLPNSDLLVTERIGRVRLIKDGKLLDKPIRQIDVNQTGESGLHGIAVHPDYPNKPYVYLYYTYSSQNDNSLNKVVRFTLNGTLLKDEKVMVDQIPGNIFHDGGRIKFGLDGLLYITTGDAQNPSLSQDKNSLAGKILRINDKGKDLTIYSMGHRNPQGITWDKEGNLWSTEHGQSATDELNLIEEGKNYGWPIIRGGETQSGMESPIIHSGNDTWAPAGMAYLNGSIFFAGLRGQALFEYDIENKNLTPHLKGEIGRVREITVGPDNMLYITTSNRDGRGIPKSMDDKIIRINPAFL